MYIKLMCFTCLYTYSWCLWAFYLHILCTCFIIATRNVLPLPSLQPSAVVLPPVPLQMVDEVSLVQPLGQQWPTPVTQGTLRKETTDIPAWPMESGVGRHLLAIVSCTLFYSYFYMGIKTPSGQRYCSVYMLSLIVNQLCSVCCEGLHVKDFCVARRLLRRLSYRYAQCVQSIMTYDVTRIRPLCLIRVHRYIHVCN